jgi:hypothetical protein
MATPPVFTAGAVLTAAQMNQIGQWVTKVKTSFSAASSITADNVFSADFESYLIQVRYITSTTTGIALQLRVGGVSAATNYNRQLLSAASTTVSASQVTSQTSLTGLMNATNGTFYSTSIILLNGPFLTEPTSGWSLNSRAVGAYTSPQQDFATFNHSTATSYDGLEMSLGAGTATGNYTVYGLRH